MPKQDGLEWVPKLFGLEPQWTKEPDIDIIKSLARKHLNLGNARCEIKFHAQGGFNKLFKVETENCAYLMRVALPVDPHHKTMSEVATIDFVRRKAGMPVPRIIAFDSSNDNDLGFEYILMELMPGAPLRERWRKLPMSTKEELIKELAQYQAKLFERKFGKIGNIYENSQGAVEAAGKSANDTTSSNVDGLSATRVAATRRVITREETAREETTREATFTLGRIVSMIFFWGDHLIHDVPRGPFQSSYDWLEARLTLMLNDQKRILDTSDDEDDIEDAQYAKEIAERLLALLLSIFPPDEPESTILFHDDLSMQNVLVDEHGKLTAVIDWECVSALPLWRACQIPHLLEGRTRDEKPRREDYAPAGSEDDDDELDNEGVSTLYWEHLLEYERALLRRLFLTEMERLQPAWVEVRKQGAFKADFEQAVHGADNAFLFKIIIDWLDGYDKGDIWSLRDRMVE